MFKLARLFYRRYYAKITNRCPSDGVGLYDPSTSGRSNLRECPKCGTIWRL